MKAIVKSSLLCLALLRCELTEAQIYDTNNVVVQSFVGSGFYGHVDGQGALTMFYNPSSVVADSSGNLFVLDNSNYRIRKVTPDGTVSTVVGGGQISPPGYGTNVSLSYNSLGQMAIDHSNVLWLAYSSSLLRIGVDGLVLPITLSGVSYASGLCVDSKGNVYVADSSANRIHRYRTNGVFEVFAGSGNPGSVDGNGIFTSFSNPTLLANDSADNIYVWDGGNYLIRRINQNRDVTTFAGVKGNSSNVDGTGTNASFGSVWGMCADASGNIILTCGLPYNSGGYCVRKLTASTNVTTMAGSFNQTGYSNGAGSNTLFYGASGVCISQGRIFVADTSNQRIRSISSDLSPQPVSPADLQLSTYPGLRINGTVGWTYRIESSTDMNTWNAETTLLLPSSPYLWIDPIPVSGNKYYRALLLP